MIASSSKNPTHVAFETQLADGWEMASSDTEEALSTMGQLRFIPARVPGTAASALRDQGMWRFGDRNHLDATKYWFRCSFDSLPPEGGEEVILHIGGIATIADVWLNGNNILQSNSMFAEWDVDVSELIRERNEIVIACRPLSGALRERRSRRPAARWRTRVVGDQQLRWFRTTLLGRAPGFAGEPQPVGPWRPIILIRRRQLVIEEWSRRIDLDADTGVVSVQVNLRLLKGGARPTAGRLSSGNLSAPLELQEGHGPSHYHARAYLCFPNPDRWWPHTHGRPVLHPIRLELELADDSSVIFDDVPVGFRSLDGGLEPAGDGGLELNVNGVPIFCRGVVWTPPDVVSLAADPLTTLRRLQLLKSGGFNLIRLAGTTVYEDEVFHRLCDELGFLVWQDLMFANMDYPFDDAEFLRGVSAEAEAILARVGRHSSTAFICGNSEVEQQVAMLAMEHSIGREAFFATELPRIADAWCPGIPYIPSAPCGGDVPFRTRSGVANYFGVGAYMRPLEDVRRAEVRFASECLAFANVPEPEALDEMARVSSGHCAIGPVWKRGVPLDSGASWDFEDVRDFYLRLLYSMDPAALRYSDANRYLELSRMVSGEVMAEVFGEWRRPASPCAGGIILWGADLEPGSGWGILDSQGQPKSVYWLLKRALAPCAVWTTDEGLNGIDVHAANDHSEQLDVMLRVAAYTFGGRLIAKAEKPLSVPSHKTLTFGVEEILGHFVDASYAYRFGPPGHDLVVVSLFHNGADVPFGQSFRFSTQRPVQRSPISEVGLSAESTSKSDGTVALLVTSRRFAWGVRVTSPGYLPDDCYFGIEPGGKRLVTLTPTGDELVPARPIITAINAEGRFAAPVSSLV
jgi:beta-mannosidase